jgi:hypothetical protein
VVSSAQKPKFVKMMCAPRVVVGLGIIDLKKNLVVSLCKWVMYALEPKDFSLRTLFKYKLKHGFPSKHKRWAPYIQWTFVHNLTPIYGSKIWDEAMKAWKVMVRKMNFPPLLLAYLFY